MNSEPMLPTSASPVSDPNPNVAFYWYGTHPEQFRQFLTQCPNATHHVDRGETGQASLVCLSINMGAPNAP